MKVTLSETPLQSDACTSTHITIHANWSQYMSIMDWSLPNVGLPIQGLMAICILQSGKLSSVTYYKYHCHNIEKTLSDLGYENLGIISIHSHALLVSQQPKIKAF